MGAAKAPRAPSPQREPGADLDAVAHGVIGAAIAVHRVLGPGFLEAVYEEALAYELSLLGIPFSRQVDVPIRYKDRIVGRHRLDLLVDGRLVVELKAVDAVSEIHTAQVLSYLQATGLPLGLVINFNVALLRRGIKRIVSSQSLGDLGGLGALAAKTQS
ncbi:MAG: GxxExxY protein [Planctomycetes bacterium]|nr:GxxExxY protein [Planctomycetota bacterium]